ncbi:hypothetical protein AVEN_198091-1 [Araneus ventricosus]|uniref:Uncharacterized protein n=1 Tax=Araneus ventricosus TaxID=182803 RepID=A0A4Y2V446_ARAVE|nr:hypothetical protein AVEN_198091-1 [Araneus ventricosus]
MSKKIPGSNLDSEVYERQWNSRNPPRDASNLRDGSPWRLVQPKIWLQSRSKYARFILVPDRKQRNGLALRVFSLPFLYLIVTLVFLTSFLNLPFPPRPGSS